MDSLDEIFKYFSSEPKFTDIPDENINKGTNVYTYYKQSTNMETLQDFAGLENEISMENKKLEELLRGRAKCNEGCDKYSYVAK